MRFPLFIFISTSAMAEEFCFNSPAKARMQEMKWRNKSQYLLIQMVQLRKSVSPVFLETNPCTGCMKVWGDSYITGIFKEEFEEKIRKEIPVPELDKEYDLPVDVSIGDLVPDHFWYGGYRMVNHFYEPFLSFPRKKSNVFYDEEKKPVSVEGKLVHPELIQLTFRKEQKEHKQLYRIGESISCIFPPEPQDQEKKTKYLPPRYFMKHDEKFLLLEKGLAMKSFIRKYIYRDEVTDRASSREAVTNKDDVSHLSQP